MKHIQDAAEQKIRLALSELPSGKREFTDYIETADGTSVPDFRSINDSRGRRAHRPQRSISRARAQSSMAISTQIGRL